MVLTICLLIHEPALGANVIAAAGSEAKLDIAKRYGGADHGVNYSKPGWQKEVLKLTKGKGVNVIYDPVGLIQGMCPHGGSNSVG
jgi:NADPH:quinone reductase-like Zn-dependent oxidoreductase